MHLGRFFTIWANKETQELLENPHLTKNPFWFYYQYKEPYEMSTFIYVLEKLVVYNIK